MSRRNPSAASAAAAGPVVVSASRRTDLPAFHAAWFRRRLAAGFCHVRHPFSGRVQRLALTPDRVVAFVLWTRQPVPLLADLPAWLHDDIASRCK